MHGKVKVVLMRDSGTVGKVIYRLFWSAWLVADVVVVCFESGIVIYLKVMKELQQELSAVRM